jgi:hypothetical protein
MLPLLRLNLASDGHNTQSSFQYNIVFLLMVVQGLSNALRRKHDMTRCLIKAI